MLQCLLCTPIVADAATSDYLPLEIFLISDVWDEEEIVSNFRAGILRFYYAAFLEFLLLFFSKRRGRVRATYNFTKERLSHTCHDATRMFAKN